MNFADEAELRSLAALPHSEIVTRMITTEREQGFTIVGEAAWLKPDEWHCVVISQDKNRIRLVLLDVKDPGHGAFSRLIAGIFAAGLIPVLVEPRQTLIDWCHRHDFRRKLVGKGRYRHAIWYPRRGDR